MCDDRSLGVSLAACVSVSLRLTGLLPQAIRSILPAWNVQFYARVSAHSVPCVPRRGVGAAAAGLAVPALRLAPVIGFSLTTFVSLRWMNSRVLFIFCVPAHPTSVSRLESARIGGIARSLC